MTGFYYHGGIFQGIVYIDKDILGWKPIADAWLESRTPQEIHVSFSLQLLPKVYLIINKAVSTYLTFEFISYIICLYLGQNS